MDQIQMRHAARHRAANSARHHSAAQTRAHDTFVKLMDQFAGASGQATAADKTGKVGKSDKTGKGDDARDNDRDAGQSDATGQDGIGGLLAANLLVASAQQPGNDAAGGGGDGSDGTGQAAAAVAGRAMNGKTDAGKDLAKDAGKDAAAGPGSDAAAGTGQTDAKLDAKAADRAGAAKAGADSATQAASRQAASALANARAAKDQADARQATADKTASTGTGTDAGADPTGDPPGTIALDGLSGGRDDGAAAPPAPSANAAPAPAQDASSPRAPTPQTAPVQAAAAAAGNTGQGGRQDPDLAQKQDGSAAIKGAAAASAAKGGAQAAPSFNDAMASSGKADPASPSAAGVTLSAVGQSNGVADASGTPSTAGTSRPALPHPASEMVAVQLTRMAAAGKASQMTIQLRPAELGAVEVRLGFEKNGQVSAHIKADRKETLDLLKQDSSSLQQALKDAGFQADGNSLSFSLNDGGSGGNSGNFREAFGNAPRGRATPAADGADTVRNMTFIASPSHASDPGRVDIRI